MHRLTPTFGSSSKLAVLVFPILSMMLGARIASAQESITPSLESSLSTGTTVNYSDSDARYDIGGGSFSGNGLNQFHHFDQFGLQTGETANFIAPSPVQNVINLVGGGPSSIDGLIQLTGSQANLYLINPAGVIFGPNARLNIPASLSVSTANGVMFEDEFTLLLTVNGLPLSGTTLEDTAVSGYSSLNGPPTGYAFSALQPGKIVNQGNLAVASGADIVLMGGTIRHDGSLKAPGGTVTLAAIPGGSLVRLSRPGDVLSLEVEPIVDPASRPVTPPFDSSGVITLPAQLTGPVTNEATQMTVTPQGTVLLSSNSASSAGEAGLNPEANGTALVRGNIDVSLPEGQAGESNILGLRVALLDAEILADGQSGGDINIGDWLDSQSTNLEAVYVLVNRGTQLSATAEGIGGNVYVWADNQVQFFGQVDVSGTVAPGTVLIDSEGTVERFSPSLSRSAR